MDPEEYLDIEFEPEGPEDSVQVIVERALLLEADDESTDEQKRFARYILAFGEVRY